jgi:hypothetical protein
MLVTHESDLPESFASFMEPSQRRPGIRFQ